ncbi:MAG: class I SAM-dependent methyltransferase [Deltaproteobacteria bacterium]|nr:class I SAM-dependent methyltransferase [Deltaproteobacteria bacterium]MCB9487176.1 class I SAM-dependent methyltransferase [Deltaproteobacteria bacterium]
MTTTASAKAAALEAEGRVKREFGKDFDPAGASSRVAAIKAFWADYDLSNKTCLDVGAGHPTVPAVLTTMDPTVRFDGVDFAPEFAVEAAECVASLGGDVSRFRFVIADFFELDRLASEGRLESSYDAVFLIESLHHAVQKVRLLKILTGLMTGEARMFLVEPVLPTFGRQKAYDQSQWARDLGYIEEPVTMSEYKRAFRDAGLTVERVTYERSREIGPKSWKRKLLPDFLYDFYRNHVRRHWALTSFHFVCRKADGQGA